MRRRRRQDNNSLELLLDTICNTFGGILFLAILVCVLLRNSSALRATEAAAGDFEAEMQTASREYEDLLVELRTLEDAEKQQDSLRGRLTTDDADVLLAQWKASGQNRDRVLLDKTRVLRDIAQANTQMAATESADRQLQAELRSAEHRMQIVRSQLERTTKQRTRAARIPRLHPSDKSEMSLLLRYNRVYAWHKYDRRGRRVGLNHEDMAVVEDKGVYLETSPKPYAGILVGALQWEAKVVKRLNVFSRSEHSVALLVWPDSFESFQDVKAVIVEAGFEYRIIPMGAGDPVVDRGGRESHVQ